MCAHDAVVTALLDSGDVTVPVKARDIDGKTAVKVMAGHRALVCDPVGGRDDCGCTAGHGCAHGVGDGRVRLW
jgi:hypothetical protein